MKKYSIFLLLLFFAYTKSANSQVTKKIIIEKLTGKTGTKAWFMVGTKANTPDRVDGDMKFVFEKKTNLFRIYRCNAVKKWVEIISQNWEILNYDPESKSPLRFDLKIAGRIVFYDFKEGYSKLHLQPAGWKDPVILY